MAGERGWREHTDEKGHHWLIIDPTPEHVLEQENEALHAQLAARDRLNDDLLKYARGREARVGTLNARVWRLIAHGKRRSRRGPRVRHQREATERLMRMHDILRLGEARSVWSAARREVADHGAARHGSAGAAARYLFRLYRAVERLLDANSQK